MLVAVVENSGCYFEKKTGRMYTTKISTRKKIMLELPLPWLFAPARGPPMLNVKLSYFYCTVESGCSGTVAGEALRRLRRMLGIFIRTRPIVCTPVGKLVEAGTAARGLPRGHGDRRRLSSQGQ